MNNKVIKVEVEAKPVSSYDTWVSGEISTDHILGEGVSDPHLTNRVSVSIHHGSDGKHSLDIDLNTWVYLSGIWGSENYTGVDLLRHEFSLAELTLIRDTLTSFIDGVTAGEISAR